MVDKEPDKCRNKVHYIGYGSDFDEWKDENELEVLDKETPLTFSYQSSIEHYCLFKDLSIKIKRALSVAGKLHQKLELSCHLIMEVCYQSRSQWNSTL